MSDRTCPVCHEGTVPYEVVPGQWVVLVSVLQDADEEEIRIVFEQARDAYLARMNDS